MRRSDSELEVRDQLMGITDDFESFNLSIVNYMMNDLSLFHFLTSKKWTGIQKNLNTLYVPLLFIFPCLQYGSFYSKF